GSADSLARYPLASGQPTSLAAGDFNGDGKPDLAAGDAGNGQVTVLLNDGHDGFQTPRVFDGGPEGENVVVDDFNRDGHPDVAAFNQHEGKVTVLLGDGDGSFRPGVPFSVGPDAGAISAYGGYLLTARPFQLNVQGGALQRNAPNSSALNG